MTFGRHGGGTNGFRTGWNIRRKKILLYEPRPVSLIDCLFYRLKHFSEFDSETAADARSYIYSSCRIQQFRSLPYLHATLPPNTLVDVFHSIPFHSGLFVPHCLLYKPSSTVTFCCCCCWSLLLFFSLFHPADVEGRFEKSFTAWRELSHSLSISLFLPLYRSRRVELVVFFTPFIFSLTKSSTRAHTPLPLHLP